jgi:hypothetical protein
MSRSLRYSSYLTSLSSLSKLKEFSELRADLNALASYSCRALIDQRASSYSLKVNEEASRRLARRWASYFDLSSIVAPSAIPFKPETIEVLERSSVWLRSLRELATISLLS